MDTTLERPEKKTLLIVDDVLDNLALMTGLLKDQYKVKVANSGEKALRLVREGVPPDLILLDIMMPGLSGYEVCQQLKADPATRPIPIIFLTALSSAEDERKGLEMGGADYITKPISPPIVLARVKTQLENKAMADFLRDQAAFLQAEVHRQTREIRAIQDVTIFALASLAETRDADTGQHIRRTQFYIKALAEQLQTHPRFAATLTPEMMEALFKSAPLHDIGKVGIPDRILLKPGRLDPDEMAIMQTHTTLGWQALTQAEKTLGTDVAFLRVAKEIALGHHEQWDGHGYPQGLRGETIPVSARLMAVADVYDALISNRVYKKGMPSAQAAKIVIEGRGSHFDPDVVDAFIALQDQFEAIAQRFNDQGQMQDSMQGVAS